MQSICAWSEHIFPNTISAPDGKGMPHLLLAHGDPNNRHIFGQMLKWANYSLDFAEDGLQAVEMWEKGEYDLVLMDIQMPGLNGLGATRAIREKERERGGHTPIVGITVQTFKEDEEMYLSVGMDYFITKPVNLEKCMQLIDQIMKQKSGNINRSEKQERVCLL